MKTTLTLTAEQCRLVEAALRAELRLEGTVIDPADAEELRRIITVLQYSRAQEA